MDLEAMKVGQSENTTEEGLDRRMGVLSVGTKEKNYQLVRELMKLDELANSEKIHIKSRIRDDIEAAER